MTTTGPALRPPREDELDGLVDLVVRVVLATGFPFWCPLLAEALRTDARGLVGPPDHWRDAVVADDGGSIVGVAMTSNDVVDDLWVVPTHQGRGVGSLLHDDALRAIAARGHATARLRVAVENASARRFYERRGWTTAATARHERWSYSMCSMTRALAATP